MTQKEKDLLVKDLSARLPYGVKVKIKYYDDAWELLAIYTNGTTYAARDIGYPIETYFEDCKPYLFPLSSMTEEQEEELIKYMAKDWNDMRYHTPDSIDWLNAHHFDFRNLIGRNLAIDCTNLNIY